MCDGLAIADRLRAIEDMVQMHLEAHLNEEDPHPHVHDGYILRSHLDTAVEDCLARAAEAAENEGPAPTPAPAPAPEPVKEPAPAPAPKKEPGPATQGAPERRHALHRRVGAR
jgi:hypothetical protein